MARYPARREQVGPCYNAPMARLLLLLLIAVPATASDLKLMRDAASRYAHLALNCIGKEFPNKPDHVVTSPTDLRSPKAMHPAFYGCFDWHSSVHGHWLLVHLLKQFPDLAEAEIIRAKLNETLTPEKIRRELEYLREPERLSFERTYGWAWLLKLEAELHGFNDTDSMKWFRTLKPLADAIASRYLDFLPKQTYPIRTGVHPNTAFALSFALDYAVLVNDSALASLARQRALDYFQNDRNYPAAWEPSGEDFLSPALTEADLMRRVLDPQEFRTWFHRFLPALPPNLMTPAVVSDRSDPKLVHLDGLNLSRAWTMRSIAAVLPSADPARRALADSADRHAKDALANVASGRYEGEHWLATFAVYMLSTPTP